MLFILDKLKILNKELQNMNEIYKTHMTALAGYGKKILQTATNLQPLYFEKNTTIREYKEERYILRWKFPLNLNKT